MPTAIAAPNHRRLATALAASAGFAALVLLLPLLPGWAWLGAVVAPVSGVGVLVAEARRAAAASLPRVRHVPGE
jgi:C4-dicarboxylate transporter